MNFAPHIISRADRCGAEKAKVCVLSFLIYLIVTSGPWRGVQTKNMRGLAGK